MKIEIQEVTDPDLKNNFCDKILRLLPNWFGIESAIIDYVNNVKSMNTWVATDDGITIGFISIKEHNTFSAEVYVMGILETYHRKRIGQRLIEAAEEDLCRRNFKFLQVKTLSESRENEEYSRTRKFYLKSGFVPLEEFKTFWGEANPCLLMVKSL